MTANDRPLTITVDGKTSVHGPGTCLSLKPHENHELSNQAEEDLVITTLGVRMEG